MSTPSVEQKILIVCAGGHGAVVADIIQRAHDAGSNATAIGFVDDSPVLHGTSILGVPVSGPISAIADIEHDAVVIALGDNRGRRRLVDQLLTAGERLATVIHPFSSISPSARIGEGSMISAGVVVCPRAVVGRSVILNTSASVDHDCVIGDFAHLSVGVNLGGTVTIGDETLVGVGARIGPDRVIGSRAVIGAGAVVLRDIPDAVAAWGVPARVIREAATADDRDA